MKKNIKLLFLICVIACVAALTGCTKDGYVASKMTVGGVDIGAMSREDAIATLENVTMNAEEAVTLSFDGEESLQIKAGDINAQYNVEKTVDNAISESKGIFSGWFKKELPMQVDLDETLLAEALSTVEREVVQTSAKVVENGIEVTNGVSGRKLDKENTYALIAAEFGATEKSEIKPEFIVTKPDEVKAKEFLEAFVGEFKEAEYVKGDDGNIIVTQESAGVEIYMDGAVSTMTSHTEEGEVYVIKGEVTLPKNTKADLEAKLFRDTLGTYKTNFASSSANRASNIELATKSISGMILMPGDVFSFNNALGERTTARGYKSAGAYVAGETVQQVGGGICQVSSTLYNTVLLSNLEIVERRSHQMTVSYVPMGRDATVNWGTTDFRFKNNTAYPIKIVGTIEGKSVTLSIVGTETIENKRVDIVTSVVSTLASPVETVEDPTKEVGYSKTTSSGAQGYIVDAARVVYSGEKQISREELVRSRYNPKKTIVTVGTKQPAPVVTAPQESTQMPAGLMPPQQPQEIPADPGI